MIFLRPEYIVFMMIPLIILFYFIVTGKSLVQTIFDEKILQKLTIDTDSLGRTGRNMMLFAALFFMIIALARPVIPRGEVEAAAKTIDLLVALDISRSMLAKDRYPTRLEFAKKKISELLDKFEEARVGVIAFASDGFIVAPLTEDKKSLKFLIGNLNTDALSTNGTDLLIPIRKAEEMLRKDREKILILFTDGGDQKDFTREIEAAKKAGISIYIYATGTHQGAPIFWHGENLRDRQGNIVISRLNPAVKQLALETGGAYIEGGYKDRSIDMIVRDIKNRFRMHNLKSRKVQDYEEFFYYPLTLAIFFMLFAFSSLPKNAKTALLLPLMLALIHSPSQAGFLDFHEIKQGISLYQAGSYRDAVRHFEKVADSRRDAPAWYDLGNAYYMAGRYKEAIHAYKKAHTNDPKLLYKLFFNMGNAYYRLQRYAKALDAYLYAKKFKSEPDLLHNIALARKHLKQKPPKTSPSTQKDQQKRQQKQKQQKQKQQQQNDKQNRSNPPRNQSEQPKEDTSTISPREMQKWERKLKQQTPRTMPLRFKVDDAQRKQNEKPW